MRKPLLLIAALTLTITPSAWAAPAGEPAAECKGKSYDQIDGLTYDVRDARITAADTVTVTVRVSNKTEATVGGPTVVGSTVCPYMLRFATATPGWTVATAPATIPELAPKAKKGAKSQLPSTAEVAVELRFPKEVKSEATADLDVFAGTLRTTHVVRLPAVGLIEGRLKATDLRGFQGLAFQAVVVAPGTDLSKRCSTKHLKPSAAVKSVPKSAAAKQRVLVAGALNASSLRRTKAGVCRLDVTQYFEHKHDGKRVAVRFSFKPSFGGRSQKVGPITATDAKTKQTTVKLGR